MIDSLVRVSRRDGEAVIMFQKKVQRQHKPSTTIKQSLICIHSYQCTRTSTTMHASFNHSYA